MQHDECSSLASFSLLIGMPEANLQRFPGPMEGCKRAGTGISASAKLLWSHQFLFPGGESKSKVALKSMANAPAMLAWPLLVAKHPEMQRAER